VPLPAARDAPLGATLVPGGATFRVWAPRANAVHIALSAPGVRSLDGWARSDDNRLVADGGYWSGFAAAVGDGWQYRYWTEGPGGSGLKRDPRARQLETGNWPESDCIVRGPAAWPWHDADFRPPRFHELIIYQLHIGVFYARDDGGRDIRLGRVSKFLDAADRIEYLAALGINAIQPLPLVEWQGPNSRGYNNTDFFSPEMDYAVPPADLGPYLIRVNAMLARKGHAPVTAADLGDQVEQLKAFVDLCHLNGIAVIGDVVYNHAGGPFDVQSMRFVDQPADQQWNARDSYFIGGDGWAGGRIFDYSADEVRGFLIDNARAYYDHFHLDGLRYDEVTVTHWNGGDRFCRDITSTLGFHNRGAIQIAEYWDWDRAKPVEPGGLGFDAALDDRLRKEVRSVLAQVAVGKDAPVNLDPVRDALRPAPGFPQGAWRSVNHLENHDLVDADRENKADIKPRIPRLAHWDDRRDWYARSRSRLATGLLLTAPGIPMLFMGQEFLEDKPWHNNPAIDAFFLYWNGLDGPHPDAAMRDFHRFVTELCWLRRRHPALCGDGCNPYYVHNNDRVLAVQRWVEGVARDVIAVASLAETTRWGYPLPLPVGGHWLEVFNGDAYDDMPAGGGYTPNAPGNPGGIDGNGPPLADCPVSARIVVPANGFLVFARDRGD
jgi:1,4-alpha-glucan branching enzyme